MDGYSLITIWAIIGGAVCCLIIVNLMTMVDEQLKWEEENPTAGESDPDLYP